MPRVDLRGHTIHYQQIGQGPDLILVHGLFCNIAFWWFRVAPKLAETHRVTAFDLRGHGFSGMPSAGYRAVDLADDIVALMDHLHIARAHVLGHSFGGAVSLALAVRHPDRVAKLTLADAWVPSVQAVPPLTENSAWPALRARLMARRIEIEGEPPLVAQSFFEELLDTAPSGAHDPGMAGALGIAPGRGQRRPSRALRRWGELMERTSAHAEFQDPAGLATDSIGRVDRPVRLIYGARSRYLDSRDGLAGLLPNRDVITLPDAGHYFPILRPEAFLTALETEPVCHA